MKSTVFHQSSCIFTFKGRKGNKVYTSYKDFQEIMFDVPVGFPFESITFLTDVPVT